MTDVLNPEQRFTCMSHIQGRNTRPELKVEGLLLRWGFAFKKHDRTLPGSPDFVFPDQGLLLFIHGCFWHRHSCPEGQPWPQTNPDFWRRKLEGNRARDERQRQDLRALGWRVEVLWECQIKKADGDLEKRLLPLLLHASIG